ncbi:MAG: sulfite exporter TauE/SafE family protein [Elusimicrobia bacterium]|nr:sulfite exporter TauE/SafE family protein [Elusimicrobiota bacterium]
MAELILIGAVSFLASGLTLFSGFGLGTLLLPAFAGFFPLDAAVAMTALVHLANNLFKLGLLGRGAHWPTAARFGLPAVLASFLGARALVGLARLEPVFSYALAGRDLRVMPVKLVVAALLIAFAGLELSSRLSRAEWTRRWLPLGGALSGFFGGLSGHQGALRSAFLLQSGLSKGQFIATGVVVACGVDAARLAVYARHFARAGMSENAFLVSFACGAAFLGAFAGSRLLEKTAVETVRRIVAAALVLFSLSLAAGLV